MEFTFSAQGPERAAVFVWPTGAGATPEQVWCTGTWRFSLSWLGTLTTGDLPFTGTAAITHCLWVRSCSSLNKSFLGCCSPYPAPKARPLDHTRASTCGAYATYVLIICSFSSENILSYLKGVREKHSIQQSTFSKTESKIQWFNQDYLRLQVCLAPLKLIDYVIYRP